MVIDAQISQKVELLDFNLKMEVLDFVDFVLHKQPKTKSIPQAPIFGCAKGQFHMADDFDAPLEDFKEYME